jgi:hypothetical protein
MRSHSINFWGRSSQISVEICEMEHSNLQPGSPQEASYSADPQSYIPWTPPQFGGYQEPANWTGNPPIQPRSGGSGNQQAPWANVKTSKPKRSAGAAAGGLGGVGVLGVIAIKFVIAMTASSANNGPVNAAPVDAAPIDFAPVSQPERSDTAKPGPLSNPLELNVGDCLVKTPSAGLREVVSLKSLVQPCTAGLVRVNSHGRVNAADFPTIRNNDTCSEYWFINFKTSTDKHVYCLSRL